MAVLLRPKFLKTAAIPIFVYGTLRHPSRHPVGNYIAEGHTIYHYYMYDGMFPVVTNVLGMVKNKARVKGSVFKIGLDEFKILDNYEGYPKFYTREMVPVKVRYDGGVHEFMKCWMWVAPHDLSGVGGTLPVRSYVKPDDEGFLEWEQDGIPF